MKIEEFQLHLTNLAQLLHSAKAKGISEELEQFAQALQPYRDRNLKDVIQIITRSEQNVRKAADELQKLKDQLKEAKAKKAKSDPQVIEAARKAVIDLYERAADPAVTNDQIDAALRDLEALDLPATQLKPLAARLKVSGKAKAQLLENIRNALRERKGMAERVNV